MDLDEAKYKHLEKIRDDTRDEIKKRIRQRDIYSIQLTIALATILGISYYDSAKFTDVIILAPLVSFYFTVLILYSYIIHSHLTTYLRTKIEPKFSNLLSLPVDIEIETYMKNKHKVGVRKYFFIIMSWIITFIVFLVYNMDCKIDDDLFKTITSSYIVVAFIISAIFLWADHKNNTDSNQTQVPTPEEKK